MTDGLRDAIVSAGYYIEGTPLAAAIEKNVRAWLSLPPSEEEILAAKTALIAKMRELQADDWTAPDFAERTAKAALVASRAVLVPPEDEKGTS